LIIADSGTHIPTGVKYLLKDSRLSSQQHTTGLFLVLFSTLNQYAAIKKAAQ
jgi:hypothetical protein